MSSDVGFIEEIASAHQAGATALASRHNVSNSFGTTAAGLDILEDRIDQGVAHNRLIDLMGTVGGKGGGRMCCLGTRI